MDYLSSSSYRLCRWQRFQVFVNHRFLVFRNSEKDYPYNELSLYSFIIVSSFVWCHLIHFWKALHHQLLDHKKQNRNWPLTRLFFPHVRKNTLGTKLRVLCQNGDVYTAQQLLCADLYTLHFLTPHHNLLPPAQPSQKSYILALQTAHHPQCLFPFLKGRPQLGGQCSLTLMLHRAQTFHQSCKGKEFHCRLLHVSSHQSCEPSACTYYQ